MLLLWSLVFASINIIKSQDRSGLLVTTENGPVRGKLMQTVGLNKTYRAFQGIPFAKPPVGELRFKDPQPADKWQGVLDATESKSECVQNEIAQGSEDCLYLNIYIPISPAGPLPTMVWIYGGTFLTGDSSYRSFGPDYLLEHGIAFASLNYRLGVFGFLSTGDAAAPGNAGLKDQLAALRWLRANGARFGLDPARFTLAGQSAGAVSVALQVQSPLSRETGLIDLTPAGLFRAAIMESGTSLCVWSLSRRAREYAELLGKFFKVNTTTSQSLVDGLRRIPYRQLQSIALLKDLWMLIITGIPTNGLIVAPVMEYEHEGAFFTKRSYELLQAGNFDRVPAIIGFNSLEAYFHDLLAYVGIYFGRYDLDVSDFVPIDMNISNKTIKHKVGQEIKDYYTGGLPIAFESNVTVQYLSDGQFNVPIRETVLQYSKYASVYYYLFSYEGNLGAGGKRTYSGVQHSEELRYLFRTYNIKPTPRDELTRSRMVTLWSNFVKYSNPTPSEDPVLENVIWPQTRSHQKGDNLLYLDIGVDLDVKVNPKEKAWVFWKGLYDLYGNPPFDTY